MARYYGGSSGPADWAAMQVQRRDDQIRDLLNMMMQIKDYRNEQAWKQKEWEQGQSDLAWNRGLEEQKAAAQIEANKALANQRGEEDPVISQARILVDTGQAKDLGTAIRMIKNIKTVDEEVALDIAKETARKKYGLGGGGREPSPNAQFDQALNIQKQLMDYANFLELQIPKLNAEKAVAKSNWETGGDTTDIDAAIAEANKRMGKARSLALRLKPGMAIDPKIDAEIAALVGGGQQPAPPGTTPQLDPTKTYRRNKKTGEYQVWDEAKKTWLKI